MIINLSEAKAHLGQYVARASAGEVITICDRNKPIAELHPIKAQAKPRKVKLGVLKGQFTVPENFNEPVPEFEATFLAGTLKR